MSESREDRRYRLAMAIEDRMNGDTTALAVTYAIKDGSTPYAMEDIRVRLRKAIRAAGDKAPAHWLAALVLATGLSPFSEVFAAEILGLEYDDE